MIETVTINVSIRAKRPGINRHLHTIHIYGDSSANAIVGVYIPKGFTATYSGGDYNTVVATNGKIYRMFSRPRQLLFIAIVNLVLVGGKSCTTNKTKKTAENTVEGFHILFNEERDQPPALQ